MIFMTRTSTVIKTNIETVPVMGTDWKTYNRVPCEVYTRVMGYLRPVSWYNIGKRSEFYSRKYFNEHAVDNSAFIRKRGN